MKWQDGRRSSNVDDRRRSGTTGKRIITMGGGGALVVIVLMLVLGQDPMAILGSLSGSLSGTPSAASSEPSPAEDALADMCSVVLADTEDTWNSLFAKMGRDYAEPTLVIYSGAVETGCGYADASSGPFYCSADQRIYIDLTFYDQLSSRFGAEGDFAQAYVIAHEVGHHVQYLLGILGEAHELMARSSETEANAISIRLELQADFFAGIWAHYAQKSRGILEKGDLEEAIRAASAVGDDAIQRKSTGRIDPETFTHGTSAQRLYYFKLGYETGDINAFVYP